MKESFYNIIFDISTHKGLQTVIYNSLYGSVTLVDSDFSFKNLKTRDIETLKTNKNLIDNEVDEINIIKSQNYLNRFNERTLELTILPTLSCNLKCEYCYQKNTDQSMTQDDIETLYNFIENKTNNINTLSILWFGGEPLIEIEKIVLLSSKLKIISLKKKFVFKNSLITNGYLLTRENCHALSKCGVRYIQITLDGPPDIHNKRKPLINGQGTFDVILNNLINSVEFFNISLRINIDHENIDSVTKLIDILSCYELQDKIYIYVAMIEKEKGVCENIGGICLTNSEFQKSEKYLLDYINNKGFKKNSIPSYRASYCTADNIHSFTILPRNKIHKCWRLVSNNNEIVGELIDNKAIFNYNIHKWFSYNPFDDKKCISCKYMPLCMGGCPRYKIFNMNRRCDDFKNKIEKYIEQLLLAKKIIC